MTDEQFKKAEKIKDEISRNKSVIKMLNAHEIRDMGITNLRLVLHHIPEVYEAMVSVITQENEKLLKQFEEL